MNGLCGRNTFTCSSSKACISAHKKCDGKLVLRSTKYLDPLYEMKKIEVSWLLILYQE